MVCLVPDNISDLNMGKLKVGSNCWLVIKEKKSHNLKLIDLLLNLESKINKYKNNFVLGFYSSHNKLPSFMT